ncbi:MAG: hypothetical protein JWP81_2043 [Ferruginibacter sp.]|nr:hypothetical protein [Ferruginibacter sp.]
MLLRNSSTSRQVQPGIVSAIIKTGLLAGTLDISAALIQFYLKTGKNVLIVLKFIASAVFGKSAFEGGYDMAAMGLLFHYIIAFGWTILFFLLYPRMPLLGKKPVITGLLYGIFVWLVMNLLVVPATNISRAPFRLVNSITGALILMLAIGLPVSLLANQFYSKKSKSAIAGDDNSILR